MMIECVVLHDSDGWHDIDVTASIYITSLPLHTKSFSSKMYWNNNFYYFIQIIYNYLY